MISILGDYNYTFPNPIPLKLKLKDLLEDNVDESYYYGEALINKTYASTLNTNEGSRRCDASNYISEDVEENYNLKGIHKTLRETFKNNEIKKEISYIDAYNRKIRDDNLSSTITTRVDASNNTYIAIKNATKQGYLEAEDGDGIDISSRMEYHRGTVQKEKSQTLTTSCDVGTIQTTQKEGIVNSDLRIRKLTPREAFRLMGVKDEDYEKCAKNQSNASLYHLAGDSIVVNVLMGIFKEML